MPHRYVAESGPGFQLSFRVGSGLRASFRTGYSLKDLRADLLAGIIVGIVALPLAMALAIASGVPPQQGLYTAIIGGGVIALLGGTRVNVSGPTAAFVVILAPIAAKFGLGGLLVATLMAGIILVIMGMARLGQLIQFIPYPVTTGFTAGIGVVIATLQIKDFFGLTTASWPEHYAGRVWALITAMPTAHFPDLMIGVLTLALLLTWPKFNKSIPSPLAATVLAAFAAVLCARFLPDFHVATIGNRFSYLSGGTVHTGIPSLPPTFILPWLQSGPGGAHLEFSLDLIRSLLGPAFAIAVLGAIESLLSAVVADGMTGSKHDPDGELIAQGIGNILCPFFGGIAATGAIARTATGIRAGARSPFAAFFHALFVLAAVLALAPMLGYLPMASLAALLMVVAWNMSEIKHFVHIVRIAPRSDVIVLVVCFALTVLFDMVTSVSVGVVLAAFLFMRRMVEISSVRMFEENHPTLDQPIPADVLLYEIAGPLFFGAAQKAISTLHEVSGSSRKIILHMGGVPAMDVTGLVALESALANLHKNRFFVALAEVQPQPAGVLRRAGIKPEPGRLALCKTLEEAISLMQPPPDSPRPEQLSGRAA